MQPVVEPCRQQLTAAQVIDIIQNANATRRRGGLEVVDLDLNVVADISDYLAGGKVDRDSYSDLHASATFNLNQAVDWGGDLLRPYIVMGDGIREARFNLGVFHPSTPAHPIGANVPSFDVAGYDILLRLSQKVGDAYGIAAGTNYLAEVEQIITGLGYSQYVIDPAAANIISPTSRAWPFDAELTWLSLANDLLASIGYQGIYSDWDGRLRIQQYQLPIDRSPEWTYTDDPLSTMLLQERSALYDYYAAPNRWVVYRTNLADGAAPSEGDGIYTYTNWSDGLTSVEARRGLMITNPQGVDVADQTSLVAAAQKIIAADMELPTVLTYPTFINPLHWHFDRMFLQDTGGIPAADVMCTRWSIPLPPDKGDMDQEWRVLA